MLKRVLVSLLLELARTSGASINVTRDTPDNGVKTAYRKVMLKVQGLGCGLQGPGVGRDGPGGLFKNLAV